MSKQIRKKALAISIASLLAMSSIPMSSSLSVYAANYVGAGNGNNSGATGGLGKFGINPLDYGIRIYCIDKETKQIKTGNSERYVIDLWNNNASSDTINNAQKYGTTCRFGDIEIPDGKTLDNTIIKGTFSQGIYFANKHLHDWGVIPDNVTIDEPTKFMYNSTALNMSGTAFAEWAKTPIENNNSDEYYQIALLYYGLTNIPIGVNDYLVIEPILYIPIDRGTWSPRKGIYDGHVVSTWYGFIQELGYCDGASQNTTKGAWGNGFIIDQNIAGLSAVTEGSYWDKRIYTDEKGVLHDEIGNNGWGLHVLEVDPIGDSSKDPIDTYNIDQDPHEPEKSETPHKDPQDSGTPDFDNTGEKTIIKTYVDLYQDANSDTVYTKAVDSGTFIEHKTSDKVVITDESEVNGGYEVVAWYTSQTDTSDESQYNTDSLQGTSMLKKSDSTTAPYHDKIGQELFTIDGYTSMTDISSNGNQSYTYINNATPDSLSTTENARQYTKTPDMQDIQEPIQPDDTDNYNPEEYIDLGGDNTIVLLYIREHDWINTTTFTGGGHGNGTGKSGGGTGTGSGDTPTPEQGELKIVKTYGNIDPVTHEIKEDKAPVTISDTTRNVHIESESGYRLAEYVYSTRGNEVIPWDKMTAESWGQLKDIDTDKADSLFYLKGFIDGFSKPDKVYGSGFFSQKYAWHDTEMPINTTGDTIEVIDTFDVISKYQGTYGTGRLSGSTLDNYNQTIYFDMAETGGNPNTDTTDDVLYLLFLKDDTTHPEPEADSFVIPESFITRHNDFATNNIKVTNTLTGDTTSYLFAEHKFVYTLPLVTGLPEDFNEETDIAWSDPYIIANISQTNTETNSGLISKWSRTEGLTNIENLTTGEFKRHSSSDNVYRTAYESKNLHSGLLKFTNANYSYVAFRKGDKPTIAQWKTEEISSTESASAMDTAYTSLSHWKNGQKAFQSIDNWNTDIVSYGNTPSGTRAEKDSTKDYTHDFNLSLSFTDTKAPDSKEFTGEEFDNVPLMNTDTLIKGNNIFRTAQLSLSDGTNKEIRLQSKYVKDISDLNVTQNIKVQTYYASLPKPTSSDYSDTINPITAGSGTGTQAGGVKIMKKKNTISFYPYHVMQFDTNTVYNTAKKANGEPNPTSSPSSQGHTGQAYVLGEQLRRLNCYAYSGVSFTSGTSSDSTTGQINIVNQSLTTAKGRIIFMNILLQDLL